MSRHSNVGKDWPRHPRHCQQCCDDAERSQILAEYAALRDEIVAAIQVRSQIQTAAIVVLGVFLGLGFKDIVNPTVILCYPLLMFFSAIEFAKRDLRISEIGDYIGYYIESRCPEMWWENYFHEAWPVKNWFYRVKWIGAHGMFVGSGLLAITLVIILKLKALSRVDWALLFLDLCALSLTWYILGVRHRRSRPPKMPTATQNRIPTADLDEPDRTERKTVA